MRPMLNWPSQCLNGLCMLTYIIDPCLWVSPAALKITSSNLHIALKNPSRAESGRPRRSSVSSLRQFRVSQTDSVSLQKLL